MMKKINNISSLYVHIPFCESICDYCDFTKLQYFHNFAVPYIEQLIKEIDSFGINHKLKTIFVGGGTPTSLEDDLFEELLIYLYKYVDSKSEFSVECNPESLSETKIKLMKKYGVNRISIGVESTNDYILKSINRKHTFLDVKNAIKLARENGINNINVDLILGLPNVTISLLEKDIENIIKCDVDHVSCYGLTVHEHTEFFNKKIYPPEDDEIRKMYDVVNEKLSLAGYTHYEISNWSKPGFMCKHNLVYWKDEQYYGTGLGASGYIKNRRYKNTVNFSKYLIDFNNKCEDEFITVEDDKTYYIMLNLRTILGLNLNEFKAKFNEDLYEKNKDYLDKLFKEKLLVFDKKNNVIYPTYEGMMTLDQIILNLM